MITSCATDDVDDDSPMVIDPPSDENDSNTEGNEDVAIFIIIDEESIDNGNEPNNFSENDVNDDISEIGLRETLRYFEANIGQEIDLFTGQVGDEGWFALRSIPNSWANAGPTQSGARNFLQAGPGLGQNGDDDLLDETRDVIPLRATGLAMLKGSTIIALVYDSDISINYDPITGNLQGENLGLVAFEVLEVTTRSGGSDSDLPRVRILIKDVLETDNATLALFGNPPVPQSSSEPEDVDVPSVIPDIEIVSAE